MHGGLALHQEADRCGLAPPIPAETRAGCQWEGKAQPPEDSTQAAGAALLASPGSDAHDMLLHMLPSALAKLQPGMGEQLPVPCAASAALRCCRPLQHARSRWACQTA